MRGRLWIGAATVIVVPFAILCYPVGGVVWSAGQVDRLALVDGAKRSETPSQVAIAEALGEVRVDRFRRVLRAVAGTKCHPQHLEFRTKAGWVSARVQCPGGFFLDYIPRPGMGHPSR